MDIKLYVTLIFLFIISSLSGQTTMKKDEIVQLILKSKVYTAYNEPAISVNLDSSFLEYHLSRLKTDTNKTELRNRFNGNTIVLTLEEKIYILNALKRQLNSEWKKSQFPNYELIKFEDLEEYLGKDEDNTIVIINEPIYLREKSLAIVFFSNLCCGRGIGGHVELSIYKIENNQWDKYIEISGGDF